MRKALILTRNFPPYFNGDASRVWKFTSNLPKIGWDPVVVAPPAVAGMAALPVGDGRAIDVHRTGPDIDASKLEASDRHALLYGRDVAAARPLAVRLAGLFRDGHDREGWKKGAAVLVEKLLAEQPEIDMLYAQGPPLEPLMLALETARKHHLTVVLDITAPLDPSMPEPGSSASSAAAQAEEKIILSGVPMTTTTRTLKEYFLKKYIGRLDHGAMTIVPPSFDPLHAMFRQPAVKAADGVMRIAFLIDELPKSDLKAAIAGMEAWVKSDGITPGDVEIIPFGEGADTLRQAAAKSPINALLAPVAAGSIDSQLGQCRQAALFCVMLGGTAPNSCTIPDTLVDALGMGKPLCGVLPEGPASKLVVDAGGATASAGDSSAIAEMFRAMRAAWRSGTLRGAPAELAARHVVGDVIHEFTRAITGQYVR